MLLNPPTIYVLARLRKETLLWSLYSPLQPGKEKYSERPTFFLVMVVALKNKPAWHRPPFSPYRPRVFFLCEEEGNEKQATDLYGCSVPQLLVVLEKYDLKLHVTVSVLQGNKRIFLLKKSFFCQKNLLFVSF